MASPTFMQGRPTGSRSWLGWLALAALAALAASCGSSGGTAAADGGGGGRGGAGGVTGAGGAGAAGAGGTNGDGGRGGSGGAGGGGGAGGVGGAGGSSGLDGGAGAGGSVGGAGGGAGAGGSDGGTDGGVDTGSGGGGGAGGGAGPFFPLDMNDVTILAPLPSSNTTPVLLRATDLADDGTALVPRALYDRLVVAGELPSPVLLAGTYERLQLVAVRFDLCDRQLPGACPAAEDGRMRLVFQPLFTDGFADDVGFHVFCAIPNAGVPGAVAALRELARIAPAQTGALRISPALAAADPAPYAAKLRAFVKRWGGDAHLVRLTMNARPQTLSQIRWTLRGVEKRGGAFADMTIVGTTAISESIFFTNGPTYTVTPAAATPSGLEAAISKPMFDAATPAQQLDYLAALAAVDNPLSHSAETTACVSCHVSTIVTAGRVASASPPIDPSTIPGRYTSTKFDLSIAGGMTPSTPTTIRALGYNGPKPMISQRVVNETAQVLAEIEARFPGP